MRARIDSMPTLVATRSSSAANPMRRVGTAMAWLLCLMSVACGTDAKDTPKADTTTTLPVFDSGGSDLGTSADTGAQQATDTGTADTLAAQDTAGEFDVSFPVGDAACKAQCTDKACGPDGCGSVCGFCPSGQVCAADGSACQAFCNPDCSGKKCGDNGCGGSCGDCPSDHACGIDFLCHEKDCTASCDVTGGGKKACGGDGCGGSCGLCATGDVCEDSTGVCSATACKGVPTKGACAGTLLTYCDGTGAAGKKIITDCDAQKPKKICGYDTIAGKYGCIDQPACTPNCKNDKGVTKECGGDGCGGTCGGGCTAGWACPGGFCKAQQGATCGPLFPPAGQCEGTTWLFCSSTVIQALDCSKAGQSCGWLAAAKTFGCK